MGWAGADDVILIGAEVNTAFDYHVPVFDLSLSFWHAAGNSSGAYVLSADVVAG